MKIFTAFRRWVSAGLKTIDSIFDFDEDKDGSVLESQNGYRPISMQTNQAAPVAPEERFSHRGSSTRPAPPSQPQPQPQQAKSEPNEQESAPVPAHKLPRHFGEVQ